MSLFRRGPTRAEAQEAIESARGVVEILKLSRANLQVPEALLQESEASAEAGSHAHATELAAKAEGIATALESEYRAATEAATKLRGRVKRMRELGIPDANEQKSLEEVHARAQATKDLDGVSVPDYSGALAVAKEALDRAEAKVALCESATDVMFAAEIAIDAAAETVSDAKSDPLQEARELLAKARMEMQEGRYDLAATDAAVAEKIALGLVDQRRRAQGTLDSVEKLVVGLRTAGVAVTPVQRSIEMGKAILAKGKVSAAIEVFNEAAQEAVMLGTRYRDVLDGLSAATSAIEALTADGLSSAEADISLGRAKSAIKQGNYALAGACCEDVHVAVARQREFRDGLRTWIDETRARITILREMGLAYVNDVQDMVEKAEQEFANGAYDATSEDLRIASLLMGPGPAAKGRERPMPP